MAKYKVNLVAVILEPKEKKRQFVISAPDKETAVREATHRFRDSLSKKSEHLDTIILDSVETEND